VRQSEDAYILIDIQRHGQSRSCQKEHISGRAGLTSYRDKKGIGFNIMKQEVAQENKLKSWELGTI